MPRPWNDWYHVTVHVYGSWLRGDPRGWRSFKHRQHVEGDYRNPPPKGKYDRLFAQSKSLMTREPVVIEQDLRQFVVDAIADKLRKSKIEIVSASVDAKHLHVLARFADHRPRHWIGIAKKHASHELRQHGLRESQGGLWAKRSRAEPIVDRRHQLSAFFYILNHRKKGAAVWTFRDAPAPKPTDGHP